MRTNNDSNVQTEQFESDFIGRFTKETEELLAGVIAEKGFVTAGHLYSLVQDDECNNVVLELVGPEAATNALNITGHQVVVKSFAFRSFERVQKEVNGEWVPTTQHSRTPFKCRSVTVPIGKSGFAMKFKYNPARRCIVVC